MAQALTITVDSAFDSSLPVSLHPVGVTGYINRYVADTLSEDAGASVNTWADQLGALNLTAPSVERRPTVGISAGRKFITFDGAGQGLTGNFAAGKVKTVAMVARSNTDASAQGYYMFNGDVIVAKHVSNNAGLVITGGPQLNTPSNSAPSGEWGIIIAVVDGANSIIRANGAASPFGTDKSVGQMARFTLGRENSVYAKTDVAELVAWPAALTAAECATVLINLRKRYAAIL